MNVLAIGAHPDDIELGCGGTLLKHRDQGDRVSLLVMTLGERGPQEIPSRIAEQEAAAEILGAEIHWGGFEDAEVPSGEPAIKVIEDTIARSGADTVYTHTPRDSHQDHRAVSEATTAACRRLQRLLYYESPSTLGFSPSFFVDLGSDVEDKLDLIRAHTSQVLKNGLVDLEAIEASARYRGFQARVRNAEAFEMARFVWKVDARPSRSDEAEDEAVIDLREDLGRERKILV